MKKNFFERISDMISGRSKDESDNLVSENNIIEDNGIDKRFKLLNTVLSTLRSNYLGQQMLFDNKMLIIWIQDSIFYDSVISSDFKDELIASMSVELGCNFRSVEIKPANMSQEIMGTEIFQNVFLQVSNLSTGRVIRTANIYPVAGNGSTLEPSYLLDSVEIEKMPGARYNIGIGRYPILSDNGHRENHIAIDDDQNSSQFNKNRYVSRAHAYISFSEEYGFLLHVEHGGTRAAQKRTHIYRGCDKIELNNTLVPEPLKDGDFIVLSKYVHLLFREIYKNF